MLAPAKINLFLHVGPAKENGRHDLDSLVMFAGPEAADRIEARKAEDISFTLHGPYATPDLATPENLVIQVLAGCQSRGLRVPPLTIDLHKHIPVAAGLGGGSADAGAMLRVLARLGMLTPPVAMTIAASLGGDVPVAYLSQPALMRGEGEQVKQVRGLPDLPALLVNPDIPCPTATVFRAYDETEKAKPLDLAELPDTPDVAGLIDWLRDKTRNDLQTPAISLVPQIGEVIEALETTPGCALARMSGSGASCFGLFEDRHSLKAASESLQERYPGWWIVPTLFSGSGNA
ncbi:4-(cytidine 5'-diphospho)-2-C-methyl-D-erythritol kinase [Henriciella sp.]|uniref:4-(cytidine 5'-diphospho)-2-C-methyl-D-erythritol kinase n=1 Tax=Henriciella sp. TaxID=1968823 RepID=UPI0026155153|nr:4-(cytidine 5'-diphospho)-2-C-methyl-D-erythritol kinase [Henriciella sp.]